MATQTYMSQQEVKLIYSEAAQEIIEIGRKHHYRFRVIGSGLVPEKPFYQGAWWFETVLEPPAGKNILDLLNRYGVAYKGIVVAHEVSLVEVPDVKEKEKTDFKIAAPSIPATQISESAMNNVMTAVAAGVVAFVGLLGLLLVELVLHDPAVIVVLEDDTWLEIANYYE
jgi:hypothetical protein